MMTLTNIAKIDTIQKVLNHRVFMLMMKKRKKRKIRAKMKS